MEIPLICNHYLQSAGIIDGVAEEMLSDLQDCDLRFTNLRNEVYALLEQDEHASYYEFALGHGLDIGRFYP